MTATPKPYPAYKESGSQWLGAIPRTWELHRLRSLTRSHTERNQPELPLLSVAREKGVFVRSLTGDDDNHNVIPEDLSNYKVARAGSLVINKMKAWQGSMGIAPCDGVVSPAYYVFDLHIANPAFGEALLRSKPYVAHFGQASDGVRIGQWDLNIARMREIPVALPPADEQSLIVRYLGYMDHRIRRSIRAKQKLIELLTEQRLAIIHRVVTQGLDGDCQLKDSGVDSLGTLPTHWEVVPLRRRWRVTDCKHLTVPFVEEGIPLASVREAQNFDLSLATANRTTADWYSTLIQGGRKPRRGDLIYCRNVGVGAASFVDTDEEFAMGQDVCLISSLNENQRYLNYFLHSPLMDRQLAALLVGSTFPRINVSEVKGLLIFVPPRNEQDNIVAYLDRALEQIDRAIGAAVRAATLLREFRIRLTADVVTGKFDVRQVAASLPDAITKEEIVFDEIEPLFDEESDEDDSDLESFMEEVEA